MIKNKLDWYYYKHKKKEKFRIKTYNIIYFKSKLGEKAKCLTVVNASCVEMRE